MLKKNIIMVGALCLALGAGAQNAYDAERVFSNELNGTARFVGMGGAMSALGGDMSVMGTNPAGIGIFRSNDASVSFGLNNTSTVSRFNGTQMKEDRTKASLDQLGFVYTYKIGNTTSLRYVNFGFNYHKSKNFNRLFSMGGALDGLSQSWQLAEDLNYVGINGNDFDAMLDDNVNPYRNKNLSDYPILSIMGVRTGVVDWNPEYDANYTGNDNVRKIPVLGWDGDRNNFYSEEKGGISQYDFSIAFNVEDRVYLGATLGIYDIVYDRFSTYTEDLIGYQPTDGSDDGIYAIPVEGDRVVSNGGYTLDNYYRLEGSGVDLKLGVILRPFEESPFRLGLSVHTPTWYELTEMTNANLSSKIEAFNGNSYSEYLRDYLGQEYTTYDYRLSTPWKFNVSAGTTLGGLIALGAEYEYADYSTSKLEDLEGFELGEQDTVEKFLKGVSTFRVGMETCITPSFSIRAGYNHSSALFKEDAYSLLSLYRTSTDFNNVKAKDAVTFGLGYRGNAFYADMALKYDMYKSDFYAFDDINLPKTEVDNERLQLIFTLGTRF